MRVPVILTCLVALPVAAAPQEQPASVPGNRIQAAPQISSGGDRNVVEEQLSRERTLRQPVAQIATSPKNATSLQATSDPTVGRTGVATAIGGKDRCDPAVPAAKRTKHCDDVIETRAAEFERPSKTELTPEQRLMLTREIQGGGENVADATRRLANTGDPDQSPNALGIAATVLQTTAPSSDEQKPGEVKIDAATQAVIDSIVPPAPPPK